MGDFSKSCSNIYLDGTVLRANCARIDGAEVAAAIDLDSFVSNHDGSLVIVPGEGKFSFSSDSIGLSNNVLSAVCRRINGDYSASSLDLNTRLTNRDGVLQVE